MEPVSVSLGTQVPHVRSNAPETVLETASVSWVHVFVIVGTLELIA